MDLGNIAVGSLVIGQLVSGKSFSVPIFLTGVLFALLCYSISYLINH